MTIRGNDDMNRELAPIAQSEEQRPSNQPLHPDGDSGSRRDPVNAGKLASPHCSCGRCAPVSRRRFERTWSGIYRQALREQSRLAVRFARARAEAWRQP